MHPPLAYPSPTRGDGVSTSHHFTEITQSETPRIKSFSIIDPLV